MVRRGTDKGSRRLVTAHNVRVREVTGTGEAFGGPTSIEDAASEVPTQIDLVPLTATDLKLWNGFRTSAGL